MTLPGGGVVFDTDTDMISAGNPVPMNGINVVKVAGSPGYTVFEAQDWTIPAGTTVQAAGSSPLVLLAVGDISVAGRLSADAPPGGGSGGGGQGLAGQCSTGSPEQSRTRLWGRGRRLRWLGGHGWPGHQQRSQRGRPRRKRRSE